MKIDVITLFPSSFQGPLDESIVQRARERGLMDIRLIDLRDFTHDKHRSVDDKPFGGGAGMLLKAEPIFEAVESIRTPESWTILLTPQGQQLKQAMVTELSAKPHLILICGHYEGVDERIREHLVDDEISIGDYILTNGNLPAMIVIDSVTRLLPGALGDDQSAHDESFTRNLLEYPHYTRPADFRGWKVPEVLVSGNHGSIAKWREEQRKARTQIRRPDLLKNE
ncbi:MAG: tRNA (guanosine(37)-N1)-methyltransferase TrmD [Verrucomicrobiae bacterium]|nr:tRNA (guanosine(37)-N1)-methyltransferase TrmD [Verrucomicrobiae bacterium]